MRPLRSVGSIDATAALSAIAVLATALFALALLPRAASAATPTGSISGKVADAVSKALPGGGPSLNDGIFKVGFWPRGGTLNSLRSTRPANAPRVLAAPSGFTVKASNGYSMFVFGSPAHGGRPAAIGIFVTGKHGGAIYSAPATVTETSIQANLGELGEISVTFHPSLRARTVRSKCGGKPVSFDSGAYEGTIDFHGEEGFTDVEATRASGDLGFLLDLLCSGSSGGSGGPFLPGAELDVEANGPRPAPHLNREGPHLKVVKNRPSARAHFEVGVSEETDGVSIERFAGLIASAHTFEYDPQVQTATVRPPAPFAGTAHFRRNAKPANRWTGDLTVDLPGKAGVKLTGSDLKASLAHAHWEWHADVTNGPQRSSRALKPGMRQPGGLS